jgi:hypothetical protein
VIKGARSEETGKAMKDGNATVDVDVDEAPVVRQKVDVLSDPQFVALFDDTGFEIDGESREFGLSILSAVGLWHRRVECLGWKTKGGVRLPLKTRKRRSDRVSLRDISDSSSSESSGSEDVNERWAESEDSNEAGGTLVLLLCIFISNVNERNTSPIAPKVCQRAPRPFSFKPSH